MVECLPTRVRTPAWGKKRYVEEGGTFTCSKVLVILGAVLQIKHP